MVAKTPHCVKHTKFIPSCKDCKDLRDAWLISKAEKIVKEKAKPVSKHHPLMPLDKKGNPKLTKKYIHFNLAPANFGGIAQLFNEMDELKYTLFHQVQTKGQDAFFIFRKNE